MFVFQFFFSLILLITNCKGYRDLFHSTPISAVSSMLKSTGNLRSQQTGIYISVMVTKLVMRSRTPEDRKQVRHICQGRGNTQHN